jgi:hypothetical protein
MATGTTAVNNKGVHTETRQLFPEPFSWHSRLTLLCIRPLWIWHIAKKANNFGLARFLVVGALLGIRLSLADLIFYPLSYPYFKFHSANNIKQC